MQLEFNLILIQEMGSILTKKILKIYFVTIKGVIECKVISLDFE
jgi:hypothetical protein